METKHTIDISSGTIFRIVLILLALLFLSIIRDIIIIILFAVIIASAIDPWSNWLGKHKIPRLLGVLSVYLGALLLFIFIVYLIVPPLVQEIKQLSTSLPQHLEELSSSFQGLQRYTTPYYNLEEEIGRFLGGLRESLGKIASNVWVAISSTFGGILSTILILVISFHLSLRKNGIRDFLRSIIPGEHEAYALDLWERSQQKVGKWLQGQLLLALTVGILVFLGLSLLGIRYSLVLALCAALLEIVPIAGPILAAIPALILAFLQSPILALWVLLLYVGIQQFENYVLVPKIMRRVVGLSPVTVLIAILIGARLAGIPGILLSIPITAVAAEFLKDFKFMK